MAVTEVFAQRATLSRSLRLLSEFRYEQTDPARFYGVLATDTAAMIGDLWRAMHGGTAAGRTLLDIGGGPGYFAGAFAQAGVRYLGVEPDSAEMHGAETKVDG
ncbi:MAG: SAM-dependent methyltransferase, partial [Mycobacterium sp.]